MTSKKIIKHEFFIKLVACNDDNNKDITFSDFLKYKGTSQVISFW